VPPTPPKKPVSKVHALILIDDANKDTGETNKAGADLVSKMLKSGIPMERLGKFVTMTGDSIVQDKIRDVLSDLPLQPDDTLVCYYSGAATYDDASKAYTLTPTDGAKLARADLRAELLLQRARLTALLTDSPTHRVKPDGVPNLPDTGGPFQLEALFLNHKGLVDWHASAANEAAFPRGNEGGLFTLALAKSAGRFAGGDQPDAWSKLFSDVALTTERLYRAYRQLVLDSDSVSAEDKRAYREQPAQTPSALSPLDQTSPVPASTSPTGPARSAEIVVRVSHGSTVTIEGVVKEFHFVNPHPFVTVDVKDTTGASRSWQAEMDNRWELVEIGMTSNTLKPGDRLIVTGSPARARSHSLYVRRLERPADGFQYEQVGNSPRIR
jgi:hypothetical protein